MTINDRISQLIDELDIKQKDFADKLNLKPNTLSMIKTHKRGVTDRVIKDIVREFNVNENWLISGEGNMFNPSSKNYINELIKQYNLNSKDKQILETYVNMDEQSRELFYNFINSFQSKEQ